MSDSSLRPRGAALPARAGGPEADRRGLHQQADRRDAAPRREDRRVAPREPAAQARHARPRRAGALRDPPGSHRGVGRVRRVSNAAEQAAVVLGAIGVVFGDIGTSPLYTLRTVFAPEHGLEPGREAVFGVVSLIFWAITLIVLGQVRDVHHARRQRRRGRDHGADRADPAGEPAQPRRADRARAARRLRRVAVLRRRDDHARDLACCRRSRAWRWSTTTSRSSSIPITLDRADACCSSPSASAPARSAGSSGRSWSSGSACWRSAGLVRAARAPGDLRRALAPPRRGVPLQPRPRGVRRARRRRARRHRRRGAVRRHGPLRRGRDPPRAGSRSSSRALILNYLGQGALILVRPDAPARARSSCCSRTGRGSRW